MRTPHTPTQPPEFDIGGGGVPAGTKTFKLLPHVQYARCTGPGHDDPMLLCGYSLVIHLSAATALTTVPAAREPAMELRDVVADPLSPGDFRPGPRVLHAVAAQPALTTARVFRANRTFLVVPLPGDIAGGAGACITMDWAGGENTDVVATPAQPSQGVVGSWHSSDTIELGGNLLDAFGFLYPDGRVVQGRSRPGSNSYTWAHPVVAQPEIALHSDYGRNRVTSLTPPLLGHALGTYYSDGARSPTNLGYSIRAGWPYANGIALPLVNLAPAQFRGCSPIGVRPGETLLLKLDLHDPLLISISPLGMPLDGTGNVDSPTIPIVPTPGLLGYYFDWQAVVVDPTLTTFALTSRRGLRITR